MIKKISSVILVFLTIFCFSACGNSEFEKKGDYLTGNKWAGEDGTLLELKTDGTHKYYANASNLNDNYYSGTFTVLNGQNAINYLSDNHDIKEEGQREVMAQHGIEDKYYYVLILDNKECVVGGRNTLDGGTKDEWFGYYTPNGERLELQSLKSMSKMVFRKK